MTQPWFDPNRTAWTAGVAYALAAGAVGMAAGRMEPRGRARHWIMTAWLAAWTAGMALLVTGAVAQAVRQPASVWAPLLAPGVYGCALTGGLSSFLAKHYREAEERRPVAKDLL